MRPRTPTTRRAFTLIEVLMVILIIGVLAAVVVPGVGALDIREFFEMPSDYGSVVVLSSLKPICTID